MAATWTIKIEIYDSHNSLVNVVGTRTNGTDIRTYTISGIHLVAQEKTTAETISSINKEMSDKLYSMYQEDIKKQNNAIELTKNWEAAITIAVNQKEKV
jgi:hypothetical protein